MSLPLVELKEFIDIKPFPNCKIHKSNQIKYGKQKSDLKETGVDS